MKKYYDENGNIVGVSFGEITEIHQPISVFETFQRVAGLLFNKPKKNGYKVHLKENPSGSFIDYHYEYEEIPVTELSDEELGKMFEQQLKDSITVDAKPADKIGFKTVPVLTGTTISWTFEKLPDLPEDEQPTAGGDDYLDPITYAEGMSIVTGKWYTDGDDIWEAIKDGVPTSFADTEYFDIIHF